MGNRKIFRCKCKKENGQICGNPLYAVKDGEVVMKRHGREIRFPEEQRAEIKCERCGGITIVGEKNG
ncbi:MAG: hypothetical protein IJX81_01060 [Clostridia bacterium]|nr:hypothetical protein [Clostridia bacterium]